MAVSQRMAAQHTETRRVQARYIIFYGTYATLCTLRNTAATSVPAHPPAAQQKLQTPLHHGKTLYFQ